MKNKMKNRNAQKLEAITPDKLIVGVDIAKELQWARFMDYRGLELRRPSSSITIRMALKLFYQVLKRFASERTYLTDLLMSLWGWNQQATIGSLLQII